MHHLWKPRFLLLVVIVCAFSLPARVYSDDLSRALDEYVQRPDPAFSYEFYAAVDGVGYTAFLINMKSQNWRSAAEVTPTLWDHWVTIIVPDTVVTTTGLLHIEGGTSASGPPSAADVAGVAPIAISTGAVLIVVQQIPMEPLTFAGEPAPVRENGLLAYGWDKVMVTGDPTWNPLFPMTKAAVRAMDVAQEFVRNKLGWNIGGFIVAGASKRGATAWLVAAVDARVKAVAPLVYPLLHFTEQLERHYASYGVYSAALEDIEARNIFSRLRSPEGELLASVNDPFLYRDRLDMPKYILNGSGDPYYLPDSTQLFFDELRGENLQRIVPNANHSFEGRQDEVVGGLIAWYQSVIFEYPRPEIQWQWNETSGTLEVSTSQVPLLVQLWQATNATARDFRDVTVGSAAWTPTTLAPHPDGIYRAQIAEPAAGFTAFLVELTYPGVADFPQVYSTSVYITPDVLPFELTDPVLEPKNADYWRHQVHAAQSGRPDDYTAEQLRKLLPVRVFGQYLTGLGDLERLFDEGHGQLKQARRDCLAARLNVEAKEIGWYSDVTLRSANTMKFWRVYRDAESAYARGRFHQASRSCATLSSQRLPPVVKRRAGPGGVL